MGGLQEYRRQRKARTDEIPDFEDGDCFHDGEALLKFVEQKHASLLDSMRRNDPITEKVLEIMVSEMLGPFDVRGDTKQLLRRSQAIVKQAEERLGIPTQEHHPSRTTQDGKGSLGSFQPLPQPRHPWSNRTPSSSQGHSTLEGRTLEYGSWDPRHVPLNPSQRARTIGPGNPSGSMEENHPSTKRSELASRPTNRQSKSDIPQSARRGGEDIGGTPLDDPPSDHRVSYVGNSIGMDSRDAERQSFPRTPSRNKKDANPIRRDSQHNKPLRISPSTSTDNPRLYPTPSSTIATPLHTPGHYQTEASSENRLPMLSVDRAIEWKERKKKKGKQAPLPHEELLNELKKRDHVRHNPYIN